MAITHNEDKGLVTLELLSQPGLKLVFREPTGRDVLLSRSWFQTNPDLQTQELLNLKLLQLTCVQFGDRPNKEEGLPVFDEWLDLLSLDNFVVDLEEMGKVLDSFRFSDRLNAQKRDNNSNSKPGARTVKPA